MSRRMAASRTPLGATAWYCARALLGVLCLGVAGCARDPVGRTVPVKGKVTVGGQQLKQGFVAYWPDPARGNESKFEAVGQINENGTYELFTHQRVGAPPGAYKVTLTAQVPSDPKNPYSQGRSLVPQEYTAKETTPLVKEVVDNPAPEAYDLSLP